jgi:hypothetical protein
MSKLITVAAAIANRQLLGAALGDTVSWSTWTVVLKAAFGMTLDDEELATFATVAGNRAPPKQRVRELWAICGRRSGKSRVAALIGVYLATCCKHALAPGEAGMVLLLASTQEQARVVFGYCKAALEASPVLRKEVVDTTRWEIRLRNGITIAVHAGNYRSVRGRTLVGAVFDECGFWRSDESVAPDVETYTAVLPALLTTNGLLVGISTGYRRAGLLFEKHRDHHGVDSADVLIVSGPTTVFNKTISEADIAALRAADPAAGRAEWDGMFRDDVASYLDDAMIDAAVEHGRPLELPPRPGVQYQAFVDASGGSPGGDAYAVAIAHREGERVILDVVRGVTGRLDPAKVTKEFAELAKLYNVDKVVGDHYAGEWVAAAWRACGVAYERIEPTGSQIYLECLPLFARATVQLSGHPTLLRELRQLERRAHRNGKDVVDHPGGCHDDHARACCGALWMAIAAAPGLWSRDNLLVGGAPVPVPKYADTIFAVAVSSAEGQLAVAYFSLGRHNDPTLALLDVEVGDLRPKQLLAIGSRLVDLDAKVCTNGVTAIFSSTPVAAEFVRLGFNPAAVPTIDQVLGDELLATSVAAHVGARRVQVCGSAMTKDFPLTFLSGAPAAKDDGLALAVQVGIAVGLDQGRRLAA